MEKERKKKEKGKIFVRSPLDMRDNAAVALATGSTRCRPRVPYIHTAFPPRSDVGTRCLTRPITCAR